MSEIAFSIAAVFAGITFGLIMLQLYYAWQDSRARKMWLRKIDEITRGK